MPPRSTAPDAAGRSDSSGPVILETKLARPPIRPEHVVRGELLELVRKGVGRKLTLLTAPPGFGKTTLLAEWAAAEEGRGVAWLWLDDADNDPARFFAYVVEALRTVEPDLGAHAPRSLPEHQNEQKAPSPHGGTKRDGRQRSTRVEALAVAVWRKCDTLPDGADPSDSVTRAGGPGRAPSRASGRRRRSSSSS